MRTGHVLVYTSEERPSYRLTTGQPKPVSENLQYYLERDKWHDGMYTICVRQFP